MKTIIKKSLSVFLAAVLVMSFSVISFAADSTGVLKSYSSVSKDDFHAEVYETGINRVFFLDSLDAFPKNVTYLEEYDLSAAGDGSVLGKITFEIGGYDLYIAANGKVKANSNSSYLFANTGVEEIIGFENFDTSGVKNMKGMFLNSGLESFDFSMIDTTQVIDMSLMFKDSAKLKTIIGSADTMKVSDMTYMFNDCKSLESFDAALSFEAIGNNGIEYMFKDCYSLRSVDLSRCEYTKNIHNLNMFQNCTALESVNFSNWDLSGVSDMSILFAGCTALKDVYFYGIKDIKTRCSSEVTNVGTKGVAIHTDNSAFMSTKLWSYLSKMVDVYVCFDGVDTGNMVNINFAKNELSDYYTVNGSDMYAGSSWEYPIGTTVTVKLKGANTVAYNINGKAVFPNSNGVVTIYLDSSAVADENCYVLAEGERTITIAPQVLHDDETIPESAFTKVLVSIKNFFIQMFNLFNSTFNKAFQGIKLPNLFS